MVLPRKGQTRWPWLCLGILGILVLTVPWSSVWAAGEPVLTINQVKGEGFPTVVAYTTVSDQSGIPIVGLRRANFEVFEDGTTIADVAVSTAVDSQEGIAAILAIDTSGSMQGQPIEDAKEAAKVFVGDLGTDDRAAIIGFSEQVDVIQDFTGAKADLVASIDALTADGNTVLYDAVYDALGHASQLPPGRKMILILTDGEDTESSVILDDAIDRAQELNVPVFAIGLGGIVADPLRRLTKVTGGRYFEAPSSAELAAQFTLISDQLRHQYVISYRSPASADGRQHTLVIKVTHQGSVSQDSRSFIPVSTSPTVSLPGLSDGAEIAGVVDLAPDIQPSDNLASVEFSLDGQSLSQVDQAPFTYVWDTSVVPLGEHTLAVTARDRFGNEPQVVVRVQVVPLLEVSILHPADGTTVAGAVLIEPSITAYHDVAYVEYALDGTRLATSSSPPFGYQWDTSGLTAGEHVLSMSARDQVGNEAQSSVRVQAVTALQVDITSPVEGELVSGQVMIEPSITALHQVTSAEYLLDGKSLATVDQAPFGHLWDATAVTGGKHALTLRVTDSQGSVAEATRGIEVVIPLAVHMTSPATGVEIEGLVTLAVDVIPPGAAERVEYLVDGQSLVVVDDSPFSHRWDADAVGAGSHTITARAIGSGQTAEDRVSITVRAPALPWGVIFAAVAIAAACIPLVVIARRRRPVTTPDSTVPPMAAGAPPLAAPATFAPTREIAAPAGSDRGPRASLQEIGGASRRWQLRAERTLIGRDVGLDGILIEDALASREHAEIRFENGAFVLHDLGATNPTHVNGEECSGRCQLRTGDELTIGGTTLIFEVSQ